MTDRMGIHLLFLIPKRGRGGEGRGEDKIGKGGGRLLIFKIPLLNEERRNQITAPSTQAYKLGIL